MRVSLALISILMLACSPAHRRHRTMELPGLMLWAWHRPENLTFLNPRTTGIAYLAGTARITPAGFPVFEPRLQPLSIPPGAPVLAVVRIESKPSHAPVQTAILVQQLKQMASVRGVRGLQIDFDARVSERTFYRSLLTSLQAQSPVPVGVTALASWCDGDGWLDGEPIAEAVPMFFRMGKDESREVRITRPVCTSAIGLSTDEPWPSHRPAGLDRIYLFSPRAWTADTYLRASLRLENWK